MESMGDQISIVKKWCRMEFVCVRLLVFLLVSQSTINGGKFTRKVKNNVWIWCSWKQNNEIIIYFIKLETFLTVFR